MDWILVVDDDLTNLKMAGHILSKHGMRVSALRSGQAMLDYLEKNASPSPDLILLDINMPGMDGFEAMKKLRKRKDATANIPIIFLSAEQNQESETKGLQLGATDYIRKPFVADILITRVQNALRAQEKLQRYEREATTDGMTGFLNKNSAEEKIRDMCFTETGFLCVMDLDSFKLINDLCGHDVGDRVLVLFSNLLKNKLRPQDVCGRIGGDEFLVFAKNMRSEDDLIHFTRRINDEYVGMLSQLLGDKLKFNAGISIGAAAVPIQGREYGELFRLADQALRSVKQKGKHNCALSGGLGADLQSASGVMNLDTVTMILEERNISSNAMWMGQEAFVNIYRYIVRYMERYHGTAYRALFTINLTDENADAQTRADIMRQFRQLLQKSLRNSDLMVEISENQIFLLLPQTHDVGINVVIDRLMGRWRNSLYCGKADITWETGKVRLSEHELPKPEKKDDWVVIVDDDSTNLRIAERILTRQQVHVTTLSSGRELLEFVRGNSPDLILLDIKMPEMDGFETMRRLKSGPQEIRDIPVIFVTADETQETETMGLRLGAEDFLKKPFIPDILTLRVRNTIDRIRLQRNLSHEVALKTEEYQKLFIHVVGALASAIDAKDTYTNGHSDRVATYARQIAQRAGYSARQQDDIYMMGLLHDVGKIGVPDAIINKPGRLTDEEFDVIKTHTVMGARILNNIPEMPTLSTGARWHHEHYGGGGYPDGLTGTNIPEEARIIAVADAYDAMTSHRSYRDILPQETVRTELERYKGTQFDPRFADIMLDIIAEDPDYTLREH